MIVVVAGCAGFIGWKVSEHLLQQGHRVIGVDNLTESYDVRLKRWRLQRLQGQEGFLFHAVDITDRLALVAALGSRGEKPPAAVINLAARAGVRQSLEDPWAYYETNLIGTLNLLDICAQQGIGRFILASTSSVYGDGPGPFREDQPTDRPLSPYAASKKAAETLCYTYHRLHGMSVAALRYFTVYGPGGRPDMAIFRFITAIGGGAAVTLYGDGSQRRDFTYVDDIACGTISALRLGGYNCINLGSGRSVELKDVLGLLEGLMGREARVEKRSTHPADVPMTWADISRAQQLLAWQPQVGLEDGLRKTVAWHQENQAWLRDMKAG